MSEKKKNSLENVENFVSSIGTVLVKVKDTIVQDMLKDIVDEGMTWEDFQKKIEKESPSDTMALFKQFVDRIINKLGYDISKSASEGGSQKLYELISTLVSAATELQAKVSALAEEAQTIDLNNLLTNAENLEEGSINRISNSIFSDTGETAASITFGNDKASVEISVEGAKKLMDLVDIVKNIISVIKQISEFEWSSIAQEASDFGKFIKDSYFTEDFGKRILDYILILLLKNAKEVFGDDIRNLVNAAKENIAANVGKLFTTEEEGQKLCRLQEEIESIKEKIKIEQEIAKYIALNHGVAPDLRTPKYLQAQLDYAEAQFEAISNKGVNVSKKAARVFRQIYCILDLMGLLQTKRINLLQYIPGIQDKENEQVIEPIEITTLRWDLFKTIFTKPLDYLKTAYHISSIKDAQKLIAKIKAVVEAFKDEKADSGSTKNLLYSLAIKATNELEAAAASGADTKSLSEFHGTIMDLLNMQESINNRFDEFIFSEFNSFREGGSCILDVIDYEVSEAFSNISFDSKGKYINPDNGIEYVDYSEDENGKIQEAALSAVNEDLIPIFKKNLQDYLTQNSEKTAKEIESEVNSAFSQSSPIAKKLCSILSKTSDRVRNCIVGGWEDHYYNVISELNDSLEYDLRDLPTMKSAYAEQETEQAAKQLGEFSDFDIDDYFAGISDKFAAIIPYDLEEYYKDVENKFKDSLPDIEDKDKAAQEVISCSWIELVSKVEDIAVSPYKHTIDIAISSAKNMVFERLNDDFSEKEDALNTIEDTTLKEGFTLVSDDEEETPWKNGLTFATKLNELLPEETKSSLKGFVPVPSFSFKLPNYSLDAKNKMLAVELCNLKSGDNYFTLQIVAFVTKRAPKGSDQEKTGIFLMPVLKGKAETTFDLGESHQLKLGGGIKANDSSRDNTDDKTGLFFYTGAKFYDIKVEPVADKESVALDAEVVFSRKKNKPFEFFSTDLAELSIENYPLSMFLSYNKNGDDGFDFGVSGSLENLKLLLKLKELNQFFEMILKDNIEVCLEKLEIGYTIKKGFNIGGSFYVNIPLNTEIEYKGIKFTDLTIELGCRNGDLVAGVSTSFTATISGCSIAFTKMGVGCTCNLFDGNGKLGTFDLDPEFEYPTGLAIAIDTSCVKGAGAVEYDKEKGKFTGMASLDIMNKVSVSALFMLTTDPFSFMGLLSATFEPGIPLGMGFSLTGVGGCLGLNRMLDTDQMREGVRQGTLASVFFVKDVSENITAMISSTEKMFPYKKKQFFVGILAQISYAPVLKCDLGLLIQLPNPKQIVIVGGIHVSAGDSDKLVAINVCFLGVIDIDKGISFDAELYDSQIVGLELSGSMAFRLFWGGDTKGFLLSIGGFHPAYKPEEGMKVADMKRLSLGLNYDIMKLKMETYLAITSNTFQIGAHLDLKVGWDSFGITGHAGFDALIQYDPFMFLFNMNLGVAVVCGSFKLMSIDLNLDVQGPAPWKVSGNAKFWFILIQIKVNFSLSWGKNSQSLPSEEVKILELLQKEFNNHYNWIAKNGNLDNSVQLAEIKEDEDKKEVDEEGNEIKKLIVQPFSKLEFTQSLVPFVTKKKDDKDEDPELYSLDICNNARPIDYNALEIKGVWLGDQVFEGDSLEIKKNDFAPSLYKQMSVKEKINSPSYVKYNSGFVVDPESSDDCPKCALNSDAIHVLKDVETKPIASKSSSSRTFARKNKDAARRYVNMLEKLRSSQSKE